MKKILLFLSITAVTISGFAQSSDPDAKKILDAVSNKFKAYKTAQAEFTYEVQDGSGKTMSTQKGNVSMKGNKYAVNFSGQQIYCDGKNVWSFDKSANEVTINSVDESGQGFTPQKLFSNFYDQDFLYKLNGTKTVNGKTIQEIEMTPRDKNKPFHKIYVLVDKASNSIYSSRILEKSGNRYVYTVNSLKPNVSLTDGQFVFDQAKHPGVEVIDLR